MEEYYYVICPMESSSRSLRKYIFGPYDYDRALEESDRLGGWEIVLLPTKNLEEAVQILEEGKSK